MPIVTGQLEEADQAAAALRRRHLGDVDGRGGRGEADRDADHDPREHQQLDPLRGGAGEGADDEDDRGEQDHQPAAVAVGGGAGDRGARDGADRDGGDDQALGEAAEAEVVLDEEQRRGDDAGVVAEQQPAEAGDRRRQHDVSACASPRGLQTVAHRAATVAISPDFAGSSSGRP